MDRESYVHCALCCKCSDKGRHHMPGAVVWHWSYYPHTDRAACRWQIVMCHAL